MPNQIDEVALMDIKQEPVSKEDIEKLLNFLPYFSGDHEFGTWKGGEKKDHHMTMPYVSYSSQTKTFMHLLYEVKFLVVFDWAKWEEGKEILSDFTKIATVDLLTLRMLMTALLRNDRFCEGSFLSAIENGRIAAVLQQLKILNNK